MKKSEPKFIMSKPDYGDKRLRKKMAKHRVFAVSRFLCMASFILLTFITISHFAAAHELIDVANSTGVPTSWGLVSAAHPSEITVPITYFDQMMDPCSSSGSSSWWGGRGSSSSSSTTIRQFDFGTCNDHINDGGFEQGIVKDHLGSDGLPIPAYSTYDETKAAGFHYQSQGVIGHDPVVSSDPFYRWYHEVDGKSYRYDRTVTFTRVGETNKYTYGGRQIFPLDNVATATENKYGHNFSFTAHLQVPIKTTFNGSEVFEFSGDDDVWVFLNGKLILDIGGVHTAVGGEFTIREDGKIVASVEGVEDKIIDAGLEKGGVYNLDFFYAERNVTEANALITITDMEWPIAAEANLISDIVDNKLIQYTASLTNRDPSSTITVNRLASYLNASDRAQNGALTTSNGFIKLDSSTLEYSYTPNDLNSWKPVEISAPSTSGFVLSNPLKLSKANSDGSTVYFRYYVAPEANNINYLNTVAFYTVNDSGYSGIAYDNTADVLSNLHVVPYNYTVKFDSKGGTSVPPQTVAEGNTATRPSDPVRDGFVFSGWTWNGSTYDFDTIVDSDRTLVAVWTEIPPEPTYYTVTFDANGGSSVPSQTVEEGDTATESGTTRTGYKFICWKLSSTVSDSGVSAPADSTVCYDFSTPVNENISLIGEWEQIMYNVVFDSAGGSAVASQVVAEGLSALEPANPVRDGYKFVGWTLVEPGIDDPSESASFYNFATPVTHNIELLAHWQIIIPDPDPIVVPIEPTCETNPEMEGCQTEPEKPETPDEPETCETNPNLEGCQTEPDQPDTPETPDTPDTPDQPDVPETPDQPDTPRSDVTDDVPPVPHSDVNDDDPNSVFLPVYGEIVYVPNTGVITEVAATVFGSESFAAIILSQGLTVGTLAVFALSFAVAYSLRKFAHVEVKKKEVE